jgi:uncharacterized protein (TIGR02145 family)
MFNHKYQIPFGQYSRLLTAIITGIIFIFSSGCKEHDETRFDLIPGTLTDITGNVYLTTIIGNQEWMAENLRTTRYNDGRSIDNPGTDNNAWEKNTKGAYSWYKNDEAAHGEAYGALYNWYAVNSGKLCPAGWRVPSDEDWTNAAGYLISAGGIPEDNTGYLLPENKDRAAANGFNAVAGGARFSSLPGGSRATAEGYFYYIDKSGRWWTSTENSAESAWYRSIYPGNSGIYRSQNTKNTGFSVRCIKN